MEKNGKCINVVKVSFLPIYLHGLRLYHYFESPVDFY